MTGKVKCTCGWSWNKSDSSKKDMYICHECGRDNSNNMKNGGWLDSYANGGTMQENQENYNDESISLPEGFVGMGNNTQGRDYSPAWGGQFQNGGEMKYYQEGLDFKPKGMEDGGWLAKYGDGGETTTDTTTISPLKEEEYYGGTFDEVTIKGKSPYPYYNKLTAEEKSLWNDKGSIGRSIRSKATDGVGFNAEKAKDFAKGLLIDTPLSGLQVGQSAMVEGIEALRGNPYNFNDSWQFDKQRVPSQTWGIENPYAAFAVDVIADPANFIGVGELSGLNKLAKEKALTRLATSEESGLLSNAYKLNPWAFKSKPEAYYRQIYGEKALNSPIITRSMSSANDSKGISSFVTATEETHYLNDTPVNILKLPRTSTSSNDALPYFNKGEKYYGSNNFKDQPKEFLLESNFNAKDYEDFYPAAMRDVSIDPSQSDIANKMFGDVRVLNPFSKEGHDINNYNLYKKDWLQGYKKIPKQEDGGIIKDDRGQYDNDIPKAQRGKEIKRTDETSKAVKRGFEKTEKPANWIEENFNKALSAITPDYESVEDREKLFKRYRPVDYPNVGSALNSLIKGSQLPERDIEGDLNIGEEAWRKALNLPGKEKYIIPSVYKPTTSEDPNAKYYTLNNIIDKEKILAEAKKLGIKPGQKINLESMAPYIKEGFMDVDKFSNIDPLQKFQINMDPEGKYVSIYDKYDFDFMPANKTITPYEFYDRFYLNDKDIPKAKLLPGNKKQNKKDGGVIKDDRGQWEHPGEITEIGSNQITMQGVPYPVLGISDTGDTQMMYPDEEYQYDGESVTEYPMAKNGIRQEQKGLVNLDQLTNFTNYNKPQPGGWLNKYN